MENKGFVQIVKESILFATIFTILIYFLNNFIFQQFTPTSHYIAIFVSSLLIYLGLLYFVMRYLIRRTK